MQVYKTSIQTALSSPEVQNVLGNAIRVKQPLGFVSLFGNQKFAEWSVPLSGSRGRGHLYAVADQVRGVWEFSRLTFEADDRNPNGRVDLTPIHQLRLLPVSEVSERTVYLVPLGLDEQESLQWAEGYYRSKFGIHLVRLRSIPLDVKLIDPARHQVNANRAFDFLAENYPEISRDPFSILIAVTSHDLYLPGFNFVENARSEGRFAVISSARLHPPSLLAAWNPEWLSSRIQKLLTKNVAMLYFDLPKSSDYTSLLSGGVLSGAEIDHMTGEVIGNEGEWHSFVESGGPSTSIFDGPGNKQLWRLSYTGSALSSSQTQVFCVDAENGLIILRKADFVFDHERALQFTRIHRNLDGRSRSFGIGGSNSFDIFLGGEMGIAVDLIMEDGVRVHFSHQQPQPGQVGDIYMSTWGGEGRFENAKAIYRADSWQVKTTDGWTYIFPYRPHALAQNVTVLTGFVDPTGREYKMERDSFGSLLSISSPSGNWLRFENDPQHRIRKITSSQGRIVRYEYDKDGRMVSSVDSDGHTDNYSYDDKSQMLTASHGTDKPVLANEYFVDGTIKNQTMADGGRFDYSYFRRERGIVYESQITDPNGLETYIQYVPGGYLRSLPIKVSHDRDAAQR